MPTSHNVAYSMSFTSGALFHLETIRLVTLYAEIGDWKRVRDRVLSENLLQAGTSKTGKAICREIISRMKQLSPKELEFLLRAGHHEQRYLLWLAICRRYPFIGEFSREILRERFFSLQTTLSHQEFDGFFNQKAEWHPNLESIKLSTRGKLRQILFRMMREAGLIDTDNTILAAMFSPGLFQLLAEENREDMALFPILKSVAKEATP